MQLASLVSERFGFKIPFGYVRMTEAGLLAAPRTSDASSSRKGKGARAAAKPSPRAGSAPARTRVRALAACDLQWLGPEEIAVRIERHGGRASRRPRWPADFVFIPFAERASPGPSGPAGQWGWAPSLGEPGAVEPPVLFIAHDTEDARIAAPTFAAFLFRLTLESLAQCPHDPSEMTLAERVVLLRDSARAVLDFLPAELSARLDRVLELPIRKVTVRTLREKNGKFYRTSASTHLSLVGTDWAARIIREELEDPRLDEPLRIDV